MIQLSSNKTIAVFTAGRSDYGLLSHLINKLDADLRFALHLYVSSAHNDVQYGTTSSEIPCLPSSRIIELHTQNTLHSRPSDIVSCLLIQLSTHLKQSEPDILVLLGDRYETFAAAQAAFFCDIPIIHLHGGETTLGAIDDRIRHAITQLSSFHFPSSELHASRIISMGHNPDAVVTIGPMFIDTLLSVHTITRSEFAKATSFSFGKQNILVTFHPETLSPDLGISSFLNLLRALHELPLNILFTYPNADPGSDEIISHIHSFLHEHSSRSWCVPSLGHTLYVQGLRLFDAVVGNSSSGIIEAPLLGAHVINIGSRQMGRASANQNFIQHVSGDFHEIRSALQSLTPKQPTHADVSPHNPLPTQSPSDQILSWLASNQYARPYLFNT